MLNGDHLVDCNILLLGWGRGRPICPQEQWLRPHRNQLWLGQSPQLVPDRVVGGLDYAPPGLFVYALHHNYFAGGGVHVTMPLVHLVSVVGY